MFSNVAGIVLEFLKKAFNIKGRQSSGIPSQVQREQKLPFRQGRDFQLFI